MNANDEPNLKCVKINSDKNGINNEEDSSYKRSGPADFETAITATGFGKFNYIFMVLIFPFAFSHGFATLSLSYVLPVAQCSLNLTLEDKGLLNAVVFAGLISGGFIFGYLSDRFGRKKLIVIGSLATSIFTVLSSLSQTFSMLMTAKFIEGFMFNGPFTATTSYISEFHSTKHRARIQLLRGIALSLGSMVLPLAAWEILPQNLDFTLFDYFDMHSWNVFLFACASASLTTALVYSFMPESPKYLMSAGRNEEALAVFRKVYRINSGKSEDTYPIERLVEERKKSVSISIDKSSMKMLKKSMAAMKPLFRPPYIFRLLILGTTAFILVMCNHCIKLWLPQLLQVINDYKKSHNGSGSNMCDMMEVLTSKSNKSTAECVVNLDNSSVYVNSIIIGAVQVVAFIIAGFFVNALGKKTLTIIMCLVAGSCGICLYFAWSSEIVTVLLSIYLPCSDLCNNVTMTMVLEIFPTAFRSTAVSIHLMAARSGSIIGNIIFPMLISSGCLPPFLFCGLLTLSVPLLVSMITSTENKALL